MQTRPEADRADAPGTGRFLRVMTYNIHNGLDPEMRYGLDAMVDLIAAQQPDVLVLNEVNRGRARNGYVDTLPPIGERLDLPCVFGANAADGLYGNALLSRYPILAWSNTHYAHNTTEVRGLLRAEVDAPGGPISFFATHLDYLDSPADVRAEQVAEALAIWDGAPRSVLLGDLNAEPRDPELQAIYRAGFVDALAAAGQGDTFTFWDPVPHRRIDYVFVTPDLPVRRAWTVPGRASDHRPVVVEVEIVP